MKNLYGKLMRIIVLCVVLVTMLLPAMVFAEGKNENRWEMGTVVNAGNADGYAEANPIDKKDLHFNWQLGEFFVDGYSRRTEDVEGNPVFLKTVGDTVTLWFHLDQDITKLNGDESLIIDEDKKGYDEYFGIDRTNFGHGTLIIKHTDYQNHAEDPVIYTDYLSAKASAGADTKVELCEEGDYEVALNYRIKKTKVELFGKTVIPEYSDYRIFFKFSVRNGNCMVYPFDVETGAELTNTSVTENGFYLDLARSRYLDINVKKEVLKDGADGLTEDVRFNRPAKDGDEYTEEGIYTITVVNHYTEQETTKRIYVGTNNILKAHMLTGKSVSEINDLVELGATISDDGEIALPPSPTPEPTPEPTLEPTPEVTVAPTTPPSEDPVDATETMNNTAKQSKGINPVVYIVVVAVVVIIVVVLILAKRKKKAINSAAENTKEDNNE